MGEYVRAGGMMHSDQIKARALEEAMRMPLPALPPIDVTSDALDTQDKQDQQVKTK